MSESDPPLKVVFDCNVFLQAAANPDGRCLTPVQLLARVRAV